MTVSRASSLRALSKASPLVMAIRLSLLPLACLTPGIALAAAPATVHYAIPAGPLDAALNQFAASAGITLSLDAELTRGKKSPGLQGDYTIHEAFTNLLQGSELQANGLGANVWTVKPLSRAVSEPSLTVVGDWLGDARESDVFEHAGARDVIRREDFVKNGATSMREVLNRIPGVNAPENNGTGSHDLAMNFGIRGLNPRLASRSTVLMDGIPVPFAPYGQYGCH